VTSRLPISFRASSPCAPNLRGSNLRGPSLRVPNFRAPNFRGSADAGAGAASTDARRTVKFPDGTAVPALGQGSPQGSPPVPGEESLAPAADVDVDLASPGTQVTFATFEQGLAPYGAWVTVPGYGSAWRPRVAEGWRPYYYGRWEWTDEGWLWVSDEGHLMTEDEIAAESGGTVSSRMVRGVRVLSGTGVLYGGTRSEPALVSGLVSSSAAESPARDHAPSTAAVEPPAAAGPGRADPLATPPGLLASPPGLVATPPDLR
jgi:hypothetical protein